MRHFFVAESRPMRGRVGMLLCCVALAGCGGDDEKSADATTPDAAQDAASHDADAKADARELVTHLEACFANEGTYEPCALKEDGTVAGEPTPFAEQAASGDLVTEVSADGYTVTATSESGTEFSIAKEGGGALERSCTPEGEGGCPDDGRW
jgi:type IV pilus assembly protein PilA